MNFFHFGTGDIEQYTDLEGMRHHLEMTFTVEDMEMEGHEILYFKQEGNIARASSIVNAKFKVEGGWLDYSGLRNSFVFVQREKLWNIAQWHVSVPEFGMDDTIGALKLNNLENSIQNLINLIGMDRSRQANWAKVKEYLIKAKELVNVSQV